MKIFDLVVACDLEWGIGKDGGLAWSLPRDMRFFRDLTLGKTNLGGKVGSEGLNVVIMGRKTWESIPEQFSPLEGRLNVVLTRQAGFVVPEGVLAFGSLDEALLALDKIEGLGRYFVIGGGLVYREAVSHERCGALYVTRIMKDFGCDTFFPEIGDGFRRDYWSTYYVDETAGAYCFTRYLMQ